MCNADGHKYVIWCLVKCNGAFKAHV